MLHSKMINSEFIQENKQSTEGTWQYKKLLENFLQVVAVQIKSYGTVFKPGASEPSKQGCKFAFSGM